jgi:hypothetical protein
MLGLGLGLIDARGEDAESDRSDSPASEQHLIARRSEGNINAATPLATTNPALNLTPATISPTEPAPLPLPPLCRARSQTQTLGEGRRCRTGRGRVVFMRGRTLPSLLLLPLLQ